VTALVARGVVVDLFSERRWDGSPIPVHYLPKSRRGRLQIPWAVSLLQRQMANQRPDVVHAHYASHFGLYGALSKIRPLVVSVWGADVEVFGERHPLVNSRVLRYIFNQAQAITASSHYLASVTQRYTPKPVAVIPFGIDIKNFREYPKNLVPEFRWIINKSLDPVYGIDIILKAFSILDARGLTSWRGRILGTGRDYDRLVKQSVALGISDRVEFLGQISSPSLPQNLAWADAGLYASHRESFGVAPLEMMALGRAVVAHNIGGLTEVVSEGCTGLLVTNNVPLTWADTLAPLVASPETIRKLGKNGPQWVASRYNFHDNVEQMLGVYRKYAGEGVV
jgi:glycosyltransferase involved in cell wall biosynthesis